MKNKPKIIIFSAFYWPYKCGYVEAVSGLANRLVVNGYQVAILTCNTHNKSYKEIINGVNVLRISCWNPSWLNNSFPIPTPIGLFKALLYFKNYKFDLILTNTRFFITSWLGLCVSKVKSKPLVHIEHGSQHTITGNRFITKIGKFIDFTFGKLLCRYADKVVGVSNAVCDFAVQIGAVNPVKIFNGIDLSFWENIDFCKNKEIVFVGRLVYAKGAQDLIRASLDIDNVIVNIVGDGPYKKQLQLLVDELQMSNRVIFWGELQKEQIKKIFLRSSVFVNPSYSEGLPTAVLEAAAASLPVIATNVGGTKEVILNTDYGIIFNPGNIKELREKLQLLINDDVLRRNISEKLKSHVTNNFSWEGVVKNYERIFNSLLLYK